ncbi:uncharacterized protein LOC144121470 [Amblyomma americanum]
MDVPVMTDVCQGGSPHASTPCMELGVTESLDALQTGLGGNYEDCGEGRGLVPKAVIICPQTRQEGLSGVDSKKEVALWALQKRCCMVRDERSNRTEERYGNIMRLGGKMSLRFDGAVTPTVLASAIPFVGLPLLVFLGVMMRHRQSTLPLLTDVKVPALIVIESLIFVGPEGVLHLCLEALHKGRHSASFAVLVLTRLLYTVWLVVSFRVNGPLLASGLAMMRGRFAMAVFLYAYDGYSKYLVCLPRTLSYLYGSETCTLPTWCRKPSRRSKEDIFEACACLYEMLEKSEHAEVIQMHNEKYGPHMRNFVRDNTVGACVWVCALCLAVLVILRMFKLIWGDIAAVVFLCKRYTAERRKGFTRNDAFQAAELALLATDTSPMKPLLAAGSSVVGIITKKII